MEATYDKQKHLELGPVAHAGSAALGAIMQHNQKVECSTYRNTTSNEEQLVVVLTEHESATHNIKYFDAVPSLPQHLRQ